MRRDDVDQGAVVNRVVGQVASRVDGLFDLLLRAREPIEAGLSSADVDVLALEWADLTRLLRRIARAHCTAGLTEASVAGMGCVAQSAAGPDEAFSMVWWVSRNGTISEKRHDLNPGSDAFYDYRGAEWFSVPRRTGDPVIAGPYIDAWGTDDLTFTAAVPLRTAGQAIGVVALDVATARFVAELTELLEQLADDSVLVNADGRVVTSTVPEYSTGLRLTPRSRAGSGIDPVARHDVGRSGWSLVMAPRSAPTV